MADKMEISPVPQIRGDALRRHVIDVAERLLREGNSNFSMRELAAQAGVSFATPFNQFGSKVAIMHAISKRRIDRMGERFAAAPLPLADATARVMFAVDIAVEVMLETPEVNRVVMAWIGSPVPDPGDVLTQSSALWRMALGNGEGLAITEKEQALCGLARQLAFAFRGVLSFWTAGDLLDNQLRPSAREAISAILLGAGAHYR